MHDLINFVMDSPWLTLIMAAMVIDAIVLSEWRR